MEARLNAVGIFTPLQFLDADEATLVKLVCKSIDGHKWYLRLRGIEVDDFTSDIKTIGRQYVMDGRLSRSETEARIIHLAEDAGYRLRSKHLYARGIYLWVFGYDDIHRHRQIILREAIHTDQDIIRVARQLFRALPSPDRIAGITLYKLQTTPDSQLSFDQPAKDSAAAICDATDTINHRFGARKIHCADTLGTEQVKCKIPFGSTRYLDHSI
jgi:DNA polymerase-4